MSIPMLPHRVQVQIRIQYVPNIPLHVYREEDL